jgi:hypothetical protein
MLDAMVTGRTGVEPQEHKDGQQRRKERGGNRHGAHDHVEIARHEHQPDGGEQRDQKYAGQSGHQSLICRRKPSEIMALAV